MTRPPRGRTAPGTGDGHPPRRPPGLARVFASCVYDGLVTLAVLFAATGAAVAVNAGQALDPDNAAFRAYLVASAFPYFGYCWTRGQTLGMRAWRLRIRSAAPGRSVSGWQALARFATAIVSASALGLGFLWIALDPQRRSWHDAVSGTRLEIVAPADGA